MKFDWLMEEGRRLEKEAIFTRRQLHQLAEVGFELDKTRRLIEGELLQAGLRPYPVGRGGIACIIEGESDSFSATYGAPSNYKDEKSATEVTLKEKISKKGKNNTSKCVLLRADMDALPISEKTSLDFSSKSGAMHACGHDLHSAMLLTCAKILARNKDKLNGKIKIVFQPAEETLQGAKSLIDAGILSNPSVDYGVMLHTVLGTNLDSGSLILPCSGIGAPSSDHFKITIQGKSSHAGEPSKGADALVAGNALISALDSVLSHELAGKDVILNIGRMVAGEATNVTPEMCEIYGTTRAFSSESRDYLKARLAELCQLAPRAFKCEGSLEFTGSCPSLVNDAKIIKSADMCLNSLYNSLDTSNSVRVVSAGDFPTSKSYSAEDFSHIAQSVPSIAIGITAGKKSDGYTHPLHTPYTTFDESAIRFGAMAYCALGIYLLSDDEI